MSESASRGVSSVLGYLLNLAIVLVLLTSIAALGMGFFDSATEPAVESELGTVGKNLAGSVQEVDRLVRESDSTAEIGQTTRVQSTIGGENYVIEVINQSYATSGAPPSSEITQAGKCDRSCLVLESTDSESLLVINYVSRTTVLSTRVSGGNVYIHRPENSTSIHIVPSPE